MIDSLLRHRQRAVAPAETLARAGRRRASASTATQDTAS